MIDPVGFRVSIEPPLMFISTAPSWVIVVRTCSEIFMIDSILGCITCKPKTETPVLFAWPTTLPAALSFLQLGLEANRWVKTLTKSFSKKRYNGAIVHPAIRFVNRKRGGLCGQKV